MNEISPDHMTKPQSAVGRFFGQLLDFTVINHTSNLAGDHYIIHCNGYRLDVNIVINPYVVSYRKLD